MTLLNDAPVSPAQPINLTPIQVYTTPGCQQCTATKRKLESMGVDYVLIDVSEDPNATDKLRELGYTQAPVVFDGFEHWYGYDPDRLAVAAAKRLYDGETLF